MVRSLQLRGVRVIDVGCFQVDLYYHPYAFAKSGGGVRPRCQRASRRTHSDPRPARRHRVGRRHRRLPFGDTIARRGLSAEGSCGLALDQSALALGPAGR